MRGVLHEAATTPPKLHEWLESIIAELAPEERSRVQEAASVAERFGARAAWRFLGEELGEEQLDKLQYNWKRFKRQLQQKDILPKLPAPTTSQAAVEELSPLQQALDTTLEELDGDLLGTLIDSHPRSKEPLRTPKEIPNTAESAEEIAFTKALATSPKTVGDLVSAFATELGLVDIQERSEIAMLFQAVDRLLTTLSDRDDKKAKDHLARLCSRTRGQIYTGIIQSRLSLVRNALLQHWTYLTAAGEEEDDEILSDIEKTLQDLETLLEERSEEEPSGLVSPVDMPEELLISDSPIHPVFLADVERVLEEATQGKSMDIASYTNALRQAGWDYADAETMLLLHNIQPQSLRDLLNAVYTEDMQEQNPSEAARIAQDIQNRVNNVGAQILDRGLATIQNTSPTEDDLLLEDEQDTPSTFSEFEEELDSQFRIPLGEVSEELALLISEDIAETYSLLPKEFLQERPDAVKNNLLLLGPGYSVIEAWDSFPVDNPTSTAVRSWLEEFELTVGQGYEIVNALQETLNDSDEVS